MHKTEKWLHLLGPFCEPCPLVALTLQLGPEEGIEVMHVQGFLSSICSGVFFTSLGALKNHRTIKVDELII